MKNILLFVDFIVSRNDKYSIEAVVVNGLFNKAKTFNVCDFTFVLSLKFTTGRK